MKAGKLSRITFSLFARYRWYMQLYPIQHTGGNADAGSFPEGFGAKQMHCMRYTINCMMMQSLVFICRGNGRSGRCISGAAEEAEEWNRPRRRKNPIVHLESCISAILPTQMAQPAKAGVAKL